MIAHIGFSCRGSYCDNVRLAAARVPEWTFLDYSTYYASGPFGNARRYCNGGGEGNAQGIVIGLGCHGGYCGKIDMACSKPAVGHLTNCRWSEWLSDEVGAYSFGVSNFITGVECRSSWISTGRFGYYTPSCDNKRFYVCSLEP